MDTSKLEMQLRSKVREVWKSSLGNVILVSSPDFSSDICCDPRGDYPKITQFSFDGCVYSPEALKNAFEQSASYSARLVDMSIDRCANIYAAYHRVMDQRPLTTVDRRGWFWEDRFTHEGAPNIIQAYHGWCEYLVALNEDLLSHIEKEQWDVCKDHPTYDWILQDLKVLKTNDENNPENEHFHTLIIKAGGGFQLFETKLNKRRSIVDKCRKELEAARVGKISLDNDSKIIMYIGHSVSHYINELGQTE